MLVLGVSGGEKSYSRSFAEESDLKMGEKKAKGQHGFYYETGTMAVLLWKLAYTIQAGDLGTDKQMFGFP